MNNEQKKKNPDTTKWFLGVGIIAAFTATLCCIAPLVLFLLGISGAWISNLTAVEPYRPYFLVVAIALVTIGYWKVYKKSNVSDCKPGTFCAMSKSNLINKVMLWIAISIIVLVLLYPYIAPLILEKF